MGILWRRQTGAEKVEIATKKRKKNQKNVEANAALLSAVLVALASVATLLNATA